MTILDGSHLSLISHASDVARVIRRAAAKVR
jgi:hypothetical protein